MSFADDTKELIKEAKETGQDINVLIKAKLTEKDSAEKSKKDELDKQGIPYCPKCLSTFITANKKGFSLGKALVGGVFTGGIGLLAGGIGKNKIELTCMKCGHRFKT